MVAPRGQQKASLSPYEATGGGLDETSGWASAEATDVVPVTVGVCAHNEEAKISSALESILSQEPGPRFAMAEVIVVASGCTDRTEEIVNEWSRRDRRVTLVQEPQRRGKAQALNSVFLRAQGDIVVSVNADAQLTPGALPRLLALFDADPHLQLACGAPVPSESADGLSRLVATLLWGLHNRTLATLSARRMPSHCCDEFLAFRRGFTESLPERLVNDGAYLGALAAIRGTPSCFCEAAQVVVDPPRTLRGLLSQRQRILDGHRQVRELTERSPSTLGFLLRHDPALAAQIISREVFRTPRSALTFLLCLLPLEFAAHSAAFMNRIRGRPHDAIWRMVE